jgi:hypothetical protein
VAIMAGCVVEMVQCAMVDVMSMVIMVEMVGEMVGVVVEIVGQIVVDVMLDAILDVVAQEMVKEPIMSAMGPNQQGKRTIIGTMGTDKEEVEFPWIMMGEKYQDLDQGHEVDHQHLLEKGVDLQVEVLQKRMFVGTAGVLALVKRKTRTATSIKEVGAHREVTTKILMYKGPPKALLDHISPTVGVVKSGAVSAAVSGVESNDVIVASNVVLPSQAVQGEQVPMEIEIVEKQVVENDQVVMEIGENHEQIVDDNGEEHHHQDANQPCMECVRLLGELKGHVSEHHSNGPNEVQKAVIRTWFECHYARKGDANNVGDDAGEIPVAVSRMTLLGEINAFLESMGWPTWKTQSALYKDWFLREIMGLSDNDIRKGRHWSLFYKDGFAPGGNGDGARNRQQRMAEMIAKLRTYMQFE